MSGYGGYHQGPYGGGYNQGGYGGGHQPPPAQPGSDYPGHSGYPGQSYGTPPPQNHGYNQYPPPQQGYNYHAPPNNPPSHYGVGNRYPPPQQPPPPTLDSYGYPSHGGHPSPGPHYGGYGGYHRGGPPPPSTPQQFGHGAPEDYKFQYSNCTGKRKALLIGINYFGQEGELKGCINDTKNISAFLIERYGYKREDMVFLTDDQQDPRGIPTRENILKAIGWLVGGAKPNDSLFLHYSGHGGRAEDLDGDEDDGYDEVIYPVDFRSAGHIVDDELHDVVVKPLQPGVRLTAIFDSCHSATVLDLPYVYSTKGVLKEPNLAAEARKGLLDAFTAYTKGDMMGVAMEAISFARRAVNGESGYKKTVETKTSPADVVMFSGSKDDQTSADANIASKATGAMSYAFIKALTQDPQQSYVELLNSIRDILAHDYSQKPQLSCSHPLDTDLLFVM
ncbi:hypothetical protein DL767_004986 [Monosporascus sp. MG133]|nr:hypothetical protein DL767_004986 [Monosporascus sp. MG133]